MPADQPLSTGHDAPLAGPVPPRASSRRAAAPGRAPSRPVPADAVGDELTEERIAEIRARIASGAYNSPEVAEEIARRMLESGDI
jgi:hypothetical protein